MCCSSSSPPVFKRGPQVVETMDPPLREEEMTHHRLFQQPPLATEEPEGPPAGLDGGVGRASTGAGAAPLEECPPPPNPHHVMAESGTECNTHARRKPAGGVTAEREQDQQY